MKCPCGKNAACVPGCALMDYPGYTVEWATPEVEADGFRTAYPEMPYSPELPDITRDPAPVTELVDEIDAWYAANDPLMAGAGDGNSPSWTPDSFIEHPFVDELKPTPLDTILEQRGSRYGRFADNAAISQEIKMAARTGLAYHALSSDQMEAIDQFACKISRIVTGDPDYVDNWDDIAGYAKLVAERLREG